MICLFSLTSLGTNSNISPSSSAPDFANPSALSFPCRDAFLLYRHFDILLLSGVSLHSTNLYRHESSICSEVQFSSTLNHPVCSFRVTQGHVSSPHVLRFILLKTDDLKKDLLSGPVLKRRQASDAAQKHFIQKVQTERPDAPVLDQTCAASSKPLVRQFCDERHQTHLIQHRDSGKAQHLSGHSLSTSKACPGRLKICLLQLGNGHVDDLLFRAIHDVLFRAILHENSVVRNVPLATRARPRPAPSCEFCPESCDTTSTIEFFFGGTCRNNAARCFDKRSPSAFPMSPLLNSQ